MFRIVYHPYRFAWDHPQKPKRAFARKPNGAVALFPKREQARQWIRRHLSQEERASASIEEAPSEKQT